MAEVYRRVVLKPDGLSADDSAQLKDRLTAAVELQQLASASPHVLQFVGELHEDASSFFIEHEPARALDVDALFDPEKPLADETLLLHLAAALADALKVAHSGRGRERIVHGGLCGGVVVETPDGVHKVTDFGFAPAVCAVLGVESYLELAVGLRSESSPPRQGTGVWEVLSPDEASRDDRICGFIDPEKYGNQMLATFEAGSDIIAAGILLHLLAEHRHPMLEDPDGHRMVVLAESMAFWPYNGARRKSLRESTDPAVRRWCELVAAMLSRLPKDRPSAADIATSLKEVGAGPVDATEALRRRVESASGLVKNHEWNKARQELNDIIAVDDVPADVAEQADTLLQEVEAHTLLAEAQKRLKSDDWQTARQPLDRLSTMSELPAEVAEQADKVAAGWRHNLETHDELDRIEDAVRDTVTTDPADALGMVQTSIDRLARWSEDQAIVTPVRARCERLCERLSNELENLKAAVKAIEAEQALVKEWFGELKTAWDQEQWTDVDELLGSRPDTPHWPTDVKAEADELQRQYAELKKVGPWLERVREAFDADNLDLSEQLLADRPALARWPTTLRNELEPLEDRLRLAKAKVADYAQARQWIKGVGQAVETEDWTAAGRQLAAKPSLDHWPPEVLEKEQFYQPKIEKQLAEQERRRLEMEEAKRLAQSWLQRAQQAAREEDWDRALKILEAPPLGTERLPDDARGEAERRKQTYQRELEASRRKLIEERTRLVHDLAAAFVRDVVTSDLPGLLDPGVIEATVGPIKWNSEEAPTHGRTELHAAVQGATDQTDEKGIRCDFAFQVDTDPPLILDDDGTIRTALSEYFTRIVKVRQKARAADLITPLRQGLFPDARLDVPLGEPVKRTTATIHLRGAGASDVAVQTELVWDPKRLTWAYLDASALAGRVLDIVKEAADELVRPAVLQRSEPLRRYASILTVDVDPPSAADRIAIPPSLTLTCRMAIRAPGGENRQPVFEFPVVCPQVGRILIQADLKPAETRLSELVVAAQKAARAAMERDLKSQVKAAPAKLKLAVLTKQIKHPVDQVQFELRPKRGDRYTLTAPWNTDTFDFEIPDNALARFDGLLRAAAEAVEKVVGEESPARRPRITRGRAFALAATAAAVVALAVIVPLTLSPSPAPDNDVVGTDANANTSNSTHLVDNIPRGDVEPTTDDEPGGDTESGVGERPTTETGPGVAEGPKVDDEMGVVDRPRTADESSEDITIPVDQPPIERPLRSPDEALEAVREVLAGSPYLTEHVQTLVSDARRQGDDQLVVNCLLPGLPEPVHTLTLALDPDQPSISQEDRDALATAVQTVDALASDVSTKLVEDVKAAVAGALDSRFVNTDRLRIRLDTDVEWDLRGDAMGWQTRDAGMTILLAPPTDTEEVGEVELAWVATNADFINGEIRLGDDQLVAGINNQVREELLSRQNQSLRQRRNELGQRIEPLGAGIETEHETLAELQETIGMSVKPDQLERRRFTFSWDRDQLVFASGSWRADIDMLVRAFNTLGAINEMIAVNANHWIRRVRSDGTVPTLVEISEPQDDRWILGLTPPWSDRFATDRDERLPVHADITSEVPTLMTPAYWPLIETYARFAGGPVLLTDSQELASLARALGEEPGLRGDADVAGLTSYLGPDAPPDYVLPQFELASDVKPELSGIPDRDGRFNETATEPTLSLAVRGGFGVIPLRELSDEVSGPVGDNLRVHINGALAALMQNRQGAIPTSTLTLTVTRDDPTGVAMQWSDVGNLASGLSAVLDEVRQLSPILESFPERHALEQEFDGELGGNDSIELGPQQAYDLLKRIWRIKRARTQNLPADLESFSVNRQTAFRSRPKQGVSPTVFVEYFGGTRWTYAIVWSVKRKLITEIEDETIQEGPFLVRVCTNALFHQPDASVGSGLFDAVLDRVPRAVAGGGDTPFVKHLGVVVAHDDRLSLTDLPNLTFTSRMSRLEPAVLFGEHEDEDVEWDSLSALRSSDWACDYVLVRTLSDARSSFRVVRGSKRWAINAVDQAMQQNPPGGS